jgi:D-alanyl-D-alanine carboxypeptidase (penicillin-binding protein 5/6)
MPLRLIIIASIFFGLSVAVGFFLLQPTAAPNQDFVTATKTTEATSAANPVPTLNLPTITFQTPFPKELTTAKAFVVYSPTTQTMLLKENEHLRLMPASTTKMMTALIAITDYDEDEVITITRAVDAIGKSTKFQPGQQFTLESILKAALINSGNDAALAIADHHPHGYQGFINRMNQQVQSWGLKNTHFANVSGVEQANHYASASDLSFIAHQLISRPELATIVSQNTASIQTIDGKQEIYLKNTNELLDEIEGIKGIKTGWTENAGECLITYIDRDFAIITVMLHSQDRFGETKALIDWVYTNGALD